MAIQRNYLQAYEDSGDMGVDEFAPEVIGALPAASQPVYEPAPVAQPVYTPPPAPVAQPVYTPPPPAPVEQQHAFVENVVRGLPVAENVSPITQDADPSTGALPVAQPPAAQQPIASTPAVNKPVAPSQEVIDALTKQILGQNLTSKWSGEGLGSAEKNAADMARLLANAGITDVKQLGVKQEIIPASSGEWGETPEYAVNKYYNKVTGQELENSYGERQTGDFFGGTFAGKGNTGYGVKFDAQGNPYFYTQGASSNDLAAVIQMAGPAAQIAMAIATGGLSIPQQIAANMAIQVLSGKDIGDAIKSAAISFAGAQIPGVDAIKEGTAFLNGIDSTGALSNAFQNAAVSGAKAALTGQDIGSAISAGALTGGVNGVVNAVLGSDDFKDLSAPQKAIAANVITGAISGKPIDQIVINSAIAAANSAIAEEKKANAQQVLSPYFTPTPVEPTPTGALPTTTTTPVEPTPVEPTPTGALPTTTTPIEPTPVEPTPIEPTPVEPTPVEPTPVEPTPTGALQLAAATPTTTTDAGGGFTLPGVDEKTAAMLAAMKDVDKVATGATIAPSWVTTAAGEEVTGHRFGSEGEERYQITRANPDDPEKPVVYEVIKDPVTGNITYEWGGVGFDENGNVTGGGTTISSGSKPSWTWPTEDKTDVGSPKEPIVEPPTDITGSPLAFNYTPTTTKPVDLGPLGSNTPADTSANVASTTTGALPVGPGDTTPTNTAAATSSAAASTPASSISGAVIANPLGSAATQTPAAPTETNTTTTGAVAGTPSSSTNAGSGALTAAATPVDTTVTNTAATGSVAGPAGLVNSNTAGAVNGSTAGTEGGTPNGSINGVPSGNTSGVVGGTNNGVVGGTGTVPGDGTGTGPATTIPSVGALPTTTTPPEEPPKTPPEEPPKTPTMATPTPVTVTPTKTTATTTQSGALGTVTTPTSTGALPGTLTATMLAAAPVKDLSGTMTQLTQLYPQLANIDPKLLQILTNRVKPATEDTSGSSEGTSFIGSKLAGAPSPNSPVKGDDNSTSIPGLKAGEMTAAGLKYLSGSPLTGYAMGGQVAHIPEFITGKTGNYVQGAGDGQSDSIPAMLADGEYVFDADTVAALGNGSNKAGAQVLDKMRESIREHKRSAPVGKIPPKAKSPLSYLKGIK